MFVKLSKHTVKIGLAGLIISALSSASAIADDLPAWKGAAGTIPVNVTLTGITSTTGPVYISIQKRAEYMGMKGHGGMIKTVIMDEMSTTFNVDLAGDYAVSVWHDLNDDGIFSMDDNYTILDGWGNSGLHAISGRPTFDDVKVHVPAYGADVTVAMKYPK